MDATYPPRLGTQGLEIKMTRFHAVTWQDGSFDRTASVLSFDSKAAREAYRVNCPQRYEFIDHARKQALLRDGRLQRLVLWAGAESPNKFTFAS